MLVLDVVGLGTLCYGVFLNLITAVNIQSGLIDNNECY